MKRYAIESWGLLLFFEFVMWIGDFKKLHEIVRKQTVCPASRSNSPTIEAQCLSVDYACVLYFKQVLCLQRSAATTLLLRRHGFDAQMVIGAQLVPFKSHAWVEIDGTVVNDKPYMLEIYQELERC